MPNSVGNRVLSIMTVCMLVCAIFIGLIQFADEVEGPTIIVPVDYATIQEAIDAANPGDTIQVWNGVYVENIIVNKTVSLIGNSSATTIIDGNQAGNTVYINSDLVNITGFSIRNASWNGIQADQSSHIKIDACNISSNNQVAIYFYDIYNGTIKNSDIISNKGGGIVLQDWGTRYTTIENCDIDNNTGIGIQFVMGGRDTQIIGCNISRSTQNAITMWNTDNLLLKDTNIFKNWAGMWSDYNSFITIDGCDFYSNGQYGVYLWGGQGHVVKNCNFTSNNGIGIRLQYMSQFIIDNTSFTNHGTGIYVDGVGEIQITNSSIVNSTTDIYLESSSHVNSLNTTFNKTRVLYGDSISTLLVRWFMHTYVNDTIGNPVPGAKVTVRNATGIGIFEGFTDLSGYARWIIVTEYLENNIKRWYHTAHNVTSYNGANFGWAMPQPNMTASKAVVVTLSQPMPTIDYIVIEDAIGGAAVGSRTYRIEDIITFYAIAYNNTIGFIGPVPADWSSNNPLVGDVDASPDSKTLFSAYTEGTTSVIAINSSATDITGILTVIWLVENLNQTTVHPTIQKAINRANPGDWLLAKPWTYYENVRVNKTVTLMGTDKSTTIINAGGTWTSLSVEVDWVNISGFSLVNGGSGIAVSNSDNSRIEDCLIHSNNGEGIYIFGSEYTTVIDIEIYSNNGGITIFDFETRDTTISNCYIHNNNGYGIYTDMFPTDTVISDCNITNNTNDGIYIMSTDDTTIQNCNIWNNSNGITMDFSSRNYILDSNIYSNIGYGIYLRGSNHQVRNCSISNNYEGIFLSNVWNSEISNTGIVNHTYGIWAQSSSECKVTNSTIVNPNPATDIHLTSNSKITTLNTTFDKNSVNITDGNSELVVRWFMHVLVEDIVGNPISGAEVLVQNSTGALVFNDYTDVDGALRWITVTEYYENQTQRTYHTPHVIRVTIGSDIVSKNVTMDTSKFVMLQLKSLQPAVTLQLVAGLQYSNVNVEYDIIASVTQDDQPRTHTADTVILVTLFDDDMSKVVDSDPMNLLDSDLGLYSYSNITSGGGVYFVVAHFTASGVTGIGLTSFEVVDWIEDISNVNDSLGQIRDALDYLNLTSASINRTLDGFIDGFGEFWNQFNGTDMSNLTNLLDWFNATMDMIGAFETNITTLLSDQNLDMVRIDGNISAIDSFMQQAFSNLYENHTTTRDIISAYWDEWNTTIGQIQGNVGFLNTTLLQLASDMALLNASLNDLQQEVDYLNQTVPTKIDDLNNQLSGVNDSLFNRLFIVENNILDNITSFDETNILSYLQGMNNSLYTEIQSLLVSITDDIIGMNASLSDELTNLLNTLTTDNTALRNWLDIVLTQIDSNLTDAENKLANKLDNLNASVTAFESNLQGDLAGILSEIQLHDTIAGDNHSAIISKLDDLLSGGAGEVDLSVLKGMLIDLAFNLSTANESIANDLMGVVDEISTFQDHMSQDLADIDSALEDLDQLLEILSKLDDLDIELTEGNQQLEDKIDEIPKDKKEEDDAMGTTELLLIVVLVLLIVNILISLMKGGGKKGSSESLPDEDGEIPKEKTVQEARDDKPEESEDQMEFGEEEDEFEDFEPEEDSLD